MQRPIDAIRVITLAENTSRMRRRSLVRLLICHSWYRGIAINKTSLKESTVEPGLRQSEKCYSENSRIVLAIRVRYAGPQATTWDDVVALCQFVWTAHVVNIAVDSAIQNVIKSTGNPLAIQRGFAQGGVILRTARARLIRDHLQKSRTWLVFAISVSIMLTSWVYYKRTSL